MDNSRLYRDSDFSFLSSFFSHENLCQTSKRQIDERTQLRERAKKGEFMGIYLHKPHNPGVAKKNILIFTSEVVVVT